MMKARNMLSIRNAKIQVTLPLLRVLSSYLALKQITHPGIFILKIHLGSQQEPDQESVEDGRG